MMHFGVQEWVDFAHGLVPEDRSIAMLDHLEDGCAECRDYAKFSRDLSEVCARSVSIPVPDWVVRNAKAIFPIHAVTQRPKSAVRIPVKLIYDSLLSPEQAGLRASWQVGWQALYQA